MKRKSLLLSGFSLTEVLIAVIIIAMIGTFGIQTYVRAYEKSRAYGAVAMLRMIRAAQRVYFLDHGTYTFLTPPCISSLMTEGYMQCPNENPAMGYDYSVTLFTPTNYTATAQRNAGWYDTHTITLTINYNPPEIVTWVGTPGSLDEWTP